MEEIRDDAPLSDAERARRYRARKRHDPDAPPRRYPGRRPEHDTSHAARATEAAAVLRHELGWLDPEDVDYPLRLFLNQLAPQIARLRAHHD